MRYAVRSRLVAVLGTVTGLTTVQISVGHPGNRVKPESIWLDPSVGQMKIPMYHGDPSAANPLTYDDVFTIPIQFQTKTSGEDTETAEARVDELWGLVLAELAANPKLKTVADPDGLDGLRHVLIDGEVTGPMSTWMANGSVAFLEAVTTATTRQ